MEKRCRTCSEVKELESFHKNKNSKDGYNHYCKTCNILRVSKYVKENLESVVRKKKERRSVPSKALYEAAQSRARERGLPFSITEEDIVIPEFCPILNVKLEKSTTGKANYNSPSLDRIIPEKGYVVGNIQVISNKANIMKNNATMNELVLFAQWVLDNFNTKELHE